MAKLLSAVFEAGPKVAGGPSLAQAPGIAADGEPTALRAGDVAVESPSATAGPPRQFEPVRLEVRAGETVKADLATQAPPKKTSPGFATAEGRELSGLILKYGH